MFIKDIVSKQGNRRARPSGAFSPLTRVLLAESARQGLSREQLAQALGISYRRLAQYLQGTGMSAISRQTQEAAAVFLDVPVVAIKLLSRDIRPEDFSWPGPKPRQERLQSVLKKVLLDPFYGALVGKELLTAAPTVQQLVVSLYEESIGSRAQDKRLPTALRALQTAALKSTWTLETLRSSADRGRPDAGN